MFDDFEVVAEGPLGNPRDGLGGDGWGGGCGGDAGGGVATACTS
ncbi:hypothetical protein [Kribbella sp. NPDC051620]